MLMLTGVKIDFVNEGLKKASILLIQMQKTSVVVAKALMFKEV